MEKKKWYQLEAKKLLKELDHDVKEDGEKLKEWSIKAKTLMVFSEISRMNENDNPVKI